MHSSMQSIEDQKDIENFINDIQMEDIEDDDAQRHST